MIALGMTDIFDGMDASLLDELGEKWKKRLLDDEPYLKAEILLSLKKDYQSIDAMIKAGYTQEMIDNATVVLKKEGYFVDLKNGIIKK